MKKIPVELKQFFLDVELLIKNKSFKQARSVLLKNSSDKYKNYLYFFYMGLIYKSEKDFSQALENFKFSIEQNNTFIPSLVNCAQVLEKQRQYTQSIKYLQDAHFLDRGDEKITYLLGRVLRGVANYKEALKYLERINSDFKKEEVLLLKADCYKFLKNSEKAIENYEQYIEINKKNFDAYLSLANLYVDKNNVRALKYFGIANKIDPLDHQAYFHLSTIVKDERKKIKFLESANRLYKNGNFKFYKDIIWYKSLTCDWSFWKEPECDLQFLLEKDAEPSNFGALSLNDDPKILHKIAIKRANRITQFVSKKTSRHFFDFKNKKIRLGYVSADYKTHPVTSIIPPLWRYFDKTKFEIYAYSLYGRKKPSPQREFIQKFSTYFVDVEDLTTDSIVKKIISDKIDILIDLNGYTTNARPDIFFYKPAPICINYLGFPGTMGSDIYDYIISDPTSIPKENQNFISEKIIYMPYTYFIFDEKINVPAIDNKYRRGESNDFFGLPKNKILLGSFNHTYKISPKEFYIWMRILKNNNNTVLVLKEKNKYAKENLRIQAKKRNVDPSRLYFIQHVSHLQHYASYRLLDIFLDSFTAH